MLNTIAISIIAIIFTLPFFSVAQVREGFDWKFLSLFIIAAPILYYIYSNGKAINDEFDRKYKLLGSKGGRANKKKQSSNETMKQ